MIGKRTTALLALLMLAAGMAPVSHAGLRRCDSSDISAPDFDRAIAAAKRAAGASKIVESSVFVCMNPGRGFVQFEGKAEPQADGSWFQPWVGCNRGHAQWRCELNKDHLARTDVVRNGKTLGYEFGLLTDMEIGAARRLVARAIELAPGLELEQKCDAPRDSKDTWAAESLRELKDGFNAEPAQFRAWVDQRAPGRFSVSLFGPVITFRLAADSDDWVLECWDMDIVVT